jgi:hypothetical protein
VRQRGCAIGSGQCWLLACRDDTDADFITGQTLYIDAEASTPAWGSSGRHRPSSLPAWHQPYLSEFSDRSGIIE